MTEMRRHTVRWLLTAALILPAPAAFAAFACPVTPPPASKPMPNIAPILKAYDDPRADPALAVVIKGLKAESMPNGEIVDHVVAAYCPTVDAVSGLSDADKDHLVERFAAELAQAVYAPVDSKVDAILLDVPLSPDLFGKIKDAADKSKLSQDAWVTKALTAAVATP